MMMRGLEVARSVDVRELKGDKGTCGDNER